MSNHERRLIEDLIPIREISAEASREKSLRHGNISTLHLWWSRKPITASRAAIYGTLVPAPADAAERDRCMKRMRDLCKWDVSPKTLDEARQDILAANNGQPPKVLDMFAGGGSIPLEAIRLGCESYAVDLNPVAHIIELCTLYYPQKYGPSLVADVQQWGMWVIARAREQLAEFYPAPTNLASSIGTVTQRSMEADHDAVLTGQGLTPIAYFWTRTVPCPNPTCGATVPLVRQTWLKKKEGKYVALKMMPDHATKKVRFEKVEAATLEGLGFDPETGNKRGNTACLFCGSTVPVEYVKEQGLQQRIKHQIMAVVATKNQEKGKVYISGHSMEAYIPKESEVELKTQQLCTELDMSLPNEPLPVQGTLGFRVQAYGLLRWKDLFTPRQLLSLLTFTTEVHHAHAAMLAEGMDEERAKAVTTYLGLMIDRLADFNSNLCRWVSVGDFVADTYARHALPMMWDFAEVNPFGGGSGNSIDSLIRSGEALENCISNCTNNIITPRIVRSSATKLPFDTASIDAVVTDPPYYDNIPYADLSDFFYVWLKRSIGFLHPEHLAGTSTPKRQEAIAEPARHNGNMAVARHMYETIMAQAFTEARRVLKAGSPLICIYAHKTTLGWSTLIEALRRAGFVITEAWPLDTERPGRVRDINSAALASSIFLVARRRENESTGDYASQVRPQLVEIVQERLTTLLSAGVTGADLVIATIGAGLRAYTQFARVELPNGDEMDAQTYLEEVEREVAQHVLQRLLQRATEREGQETTSAQMAAVDTTTRFYVTARFFYEEAPVPFDDMNMLARGLGVELDGPRGLTQGRQGLVKKEKETIGLRDYRARGAEEALGLPTESGNAAPLIDVLQRLLWLQDKQPYAVSDFLLKAHAHTDQLRLVAQTLAGHALTPTSDNGITKQERTEEQKAVDRLLAGWRNMVQEMSGQTLWG